MRAIITGGNKGIGLAITQHLIAHGFEVHNLSRSGFEYFSSEKLNHWPADVSHYEQCSQIIDHINDEFGNIDVFIYNAGLMNTITAADYSELEIDHILTINMINAIRLSVYVAEKMAIQQSGRIIAMGSIAGEIGHPDIWYGISKAGLMNGMRSIARTYGTRGIVANAIAPGPVETDMMRQIPLERQARLKAATINQQFCTVDDIAETVLWLATRAPNSFNGEIIDLNNGANYR